jgi:hypothetical protein
MVSENYSRGEFGPVLFRFGATLYQWSIGTLSSVTGSNRQAACDGIGYLAAGRGGACRYVGRSWGRRYTGYTNRPRMRSDGRGRVPMAESEILGCLLLHKVDGG